MAWNSNPIFADLPFSMRKWVCGTSEVLKTALSAKALSACILGLQPMRLLLNKDYHPPCLSFEWLCYQPACSVLVFTHVLLAMRSASSAYTRCQRFISHFYLHDVPHTSTPFDTGFCGLQIVLFIVSSCSYIGASSKKQGYSSAQWEIVL